MSVFDELNLGAKYSKKDLAEILKEDSIIPIREGVFSCKKSNSYFLNVIRDQVAKALTDYLRANQE